MTTATGNGIVARKTRLIKQLSPQFEASLRDGIIFKPVNRFREPGWLPESLKLVEDLFTARQEKQKAEGK